MLLSPSAGVWAVVLQVVLPVSCSSLCIWWSTLCCLKCVLSFKLQDDRQDKARHFIAEGRVGSLTQTFNAPEGDWSELHINISPEEDKDLIKWHWASVLLSPLCFHSTHNRCPPPLACAVVPSMNGPALCEMLLMLLVSGAVQSTCEV